MKVLKHPDTSTWKFEHTCSACDAVLEVEAKDINHKTERGDRPSESDYDSYYAYCAVCSTQFTIPEGKLTKAVKHLAKRKGSGGGGSYFDR